jgi:hypothetical protein
VSQPVFSHVAQAIGARSRTLPTVRLLIAVDEVALVVRILCRLHPRFHLARRAIEEEAVHVADVDVDLVHQLRAQRRPVLLQVVQQVVVLAPVVGDRVIDLARA